MSTNAYKRGPSVQPNEHSGFALELAKYLDHLRGTMSGRELARRAATGTHDHWAKILRGEKVMTTNDIKVAAEIFDVSPYDFVAQARLFIAGVGGSVEDRVELTREEEQALRPEDVDLAALRGRDETETEPAN